MKKALLVACCFLLLYPNFLNAQNVNLTETASSYVLKNANVSVTIGKSSANISNITYKSLNLLSGGYNGGQVYWSWNMPNYQNPYNCVASITTNPSSNGNTFGEVKLHMVWDGTAATAAMDVDIYYSLTNDASGIYASAMLTHPSAYPANPGGEWRMVSYPGTMFDWLSVDTLRNRKMASYTDWSNATAVSGAPKEVELLHSGIYANQYECKYDYSADFGDISTWGWSSTTNNVGIWVTAPSKEYYNGGPMKRELMCHNSPTMLNMLGGQHYGMGDEMNIAAGENWQKVFGPFLIYCNNVPAGTANANLALWSDATAQATAEQAKWPYSWYTNPAYLQEAARGTITGKLAINDVGSLTPTSPANMWVGVGITPLGGSTDFQHWAKNYQFWIKTDANGNFTIPHVMPGTYNLYAFGPGAAGQLTLNNYVTVTAGNTNALGTVTWVPTRTAPTIWEIGTPDRSAKEFKHGADWWTSNTYPSPNWAKYMDYPTEFPHDVNYTIGQSNPVTDWNFAFTYDKMVQSTSPAWTVNFNLTTAPTAGSTVAVYTAIAAYYSSALILSVNGVNVTSPSTGALPSSPSDALIRKGIHGAFAENRFTFPASNLHVGNNQIVFTQRPSGGATFGNFMFDYVRLEAVGTNVVLPISFTSIRAYQQNQGVMVEWSLATENSIMGYDVERSVDGVTFTKLATVPSKGDNSIGATYTYYDAAPNSGNNFYRIKAIGKSGNAQYSKMVNVPLSNLNSGLTIYPNPIIGNTVTLQMTSLDKGNYTLHLINSLGQQLLNTSIVYTGGTAVQNIPLGASLPKGIYQMQLVDVNGKSITQNMIKN